MPKKRYANQYSRKYGFERPERPPSRTSSDAVQPGLSSSRFFTGIHLTDEALQKYREAVKKSTGQDITMERARVSATNFVGLIRMLCHEPPAPKKNAGPTPGSARDFKDVGDVPPNGVEE